MPSGILKYNTGCLLNWDRICFLLLGGFYWLNERFKAFLIAVLHIISPWLYSAPQVYFQTNYGGRFVPNL